MTSIPTVMAKKYTKPHKVYGNDKKVFNNEKKLAFLPI